MKTIPLKRLAHVIPGQSPPGNAVEPLTDGQPFIQGNAEFTDTSPAPMLQSPSAPKVAMAGDILISVRAPVGALNRADQTMGIGRGVAAIRVKNAVDPRFVRYALVSEMPALRSVATGSTYEAVSAGQIGGLALPDCSHNDQRRIADFLDDQVSRIDNIIAARRQQIDAVDRLHAGRTRDLVLGLGDSGRTSTGLHWASETSAAWRPRRLSQLATMGTGHTPSRSKSEYWENMDVPWLTTSDVYRFRDDSIRRVAETTVQISELGLVNSAAVMHPAQTVGLCRTSGSAGYSIIMDRAMATSQDFVTWTCGAHLEPEFLLSQLRVMRGYLLNYLAMGSTHKTIYFPELEGLVVPIPTVSIQRAVVTDLLRADLDRASARRDLSEQVARLTEYKQSLITAAVTGELDVTTASKRVSA